MNIKSRKGFTLIELLAVVVIVGILLGISIVAVMRFIDKARDEQVKSQEDTLVMAAKNYLQENRGMLPKSIGETTTITVDVLKNNNYLTTNLKNSKKESCMDNSYVTAYKESATKYVYKAHLYCGGDAPTTVVASSTPTIKIDFVDSLGKSIKNDPSVLEKVSEAKFIIEYSGGTRDGKKIAIDGYSYSILIKTGDQSGLNEVYSSGTLSANHATNIYVDRDNNLSDYIDISNPTTVAIKATVRNLDGGINDKIEFVGEEGDQAQVVYHDKTAPTCVTGQTIGEASENDWININTSNRERRITVLCKDGSGSGCIRSKFTKSWTGSESFEYDSIQIKDNAGNTTNCKVRVNIDKSYPVISLGAYNSASSNTNLLTGTNTTENSSTGSATINANEYANLVSGYMNKEKYPNGVIYKVNLNDNIAIKSWKWEVNAAEISSTSDPKYGVVSAVGEADSGDSSCTGQKDCSFSIGFTDNGLRKGVLTVYDKAGNKSTFTIYANINRVIPGVPSIINSSNGTETGTWTKSSVSLTLSTGNHIMPISGYYYSYKSDANGFGSDPNNKWVKLEGSVDENDSSSFVTASWNSEINKKIYVIACDSAGNCSDSRSTKIMIDRTAPTGLEVTGYKKNNSADTSSFEGLETINSNKWHSGWILTIPNSASDGNGSGNIYYKVKVTGASTNTVDEVRSYRNVNAEGISTVSYKACDKLDNCSGYVDFIVKLDRTGPTKPTISNSTGGNWSDSPVTLTIGSSDSSAGIGKYYYSYRPDNAANWVEMTEGNNLLSFEKTWSADINKTIYIKACDKVGNCSSENNTIIRIDTGAPLTPEIENPTSGDWTNSNFSLMLYSMDEGSGLADYQYTYNANATVVGSDANTQWKSDGQLATEMYTTNEFSAERDQLVYWRVCDGLGNCSGKSSTRIRIDKTKPSCGTVNTTQNNSQYGVSGTIACSDSDSQCEKQTYNFELLKATDSVTIKDNAGNTKACSIPIAGVDCSTYGTWQYSSLFPTVNNNCPSDKTGWDYEFETCSTDLFYNDVCGSPCANKCKNLANCKYVCCVYRRKDEKTCYEYVSS